MPISKEFCFYCRKPHLQNLWWRGKLQEQRDPRGGRGALQSGGVNTGPQPSHLVALDLTLDDSYINHLQEKALRVLIAKTAAILHSSLWPTPSATWFYSCSPSEADSLPPNLASELVLPALACTTRGVMIVRQFGAWAQKVLDASAFSFRIQLSPSPREPTGGWDTTRKRTKVPTWQPAHLQKQSPQQLTTHTWRSPAETRLVLRSPAWTADQLSHELDKYWGGLLHKS